MTTTPKTNRPSTGDSVVDEVRRTKIKLLERHQYDLDAMIRDARARINQDTGSWTGLPGVDRA